MEYFLGSLWCGCGEWRVMAVSGVYRGQRAERQECGSWRSEFDWFHHPAAGHSHQGIRADRASEMRWCSLMHFKSYSQIKCDYILQDILLLSLAKVQCPRVKSFHINSCLQCSFIYPNIDVWYLQKIYCETKSEYSGVWQVCRPRTRGSYTWRQQVRESKGVYFRTLAFVFYFG